MPCARPSTSIRSTPPPITSSAWRWAHWGKTQMPSPATERPSRSTRMTPGHQLLVEALQKSGKPDLVVAALHEWVAPDPPMPRPTTASAPHWSSRRSWTRPSPPFARPSKSTQNTSKPTSTLATPSAPRASWTRPSPSSARRSPWKRKRRLPLLARPHPSSPGQSAERSGLAIGNRR